MSLAPLPITLTSPEAHQDVNALRTTSLRNAAIVVMALSYEWIIYLTIFANGATAASWLLPVSLMLISGKAFWLLKIKPMLACVSFPIELLAAILCYLCFEPISLVVLFTVPVIFLCSVVVTHWWMLGITGAACASLAIMIGLHGPMVSALYGATIIMNLLTGLIAWFSLNNLYMAIEWATYSQKQAQESIESARERRAELRKMADMLRHNQERLHYLNIRLEQARVAAEEAYRTKQHFVANVSHELRTPLNLITGFSEMMAFSPESYGGVRLPPQYQEDVMEIYRSSKHLLSLIEDVLALAQLEAGQMIVQREWTDLATIIHEAADTLRPLIEAKGLVLQTVVPPDLPAVYMDAGRIRQVLLNILNNAYRFTEQGSIRVEVTMQPEEVLVQVRDTGVGISPDDLPLIFEEFHNLAGGPSARRDGFGLGLSISRRLVEAHGGRLWATSDRGVGSCFSIALPIEIRDPSVGRPTLVRTGPRAKMERTRPVILEVGEEPGHEMLERRLSEYRVVHVRPQQVASVYERYVPVALWLNDPSSHDELPHYLAPLLRAAPTLPVISCRIPTQTDLARKLRTDFFFPKPVTREKIARAIEQLSEHRPIKRVLIIDDDPSMVRLLQRVLLSLDGPPLQVIEACGGQEGLALLESERPDLVLLDLAMPEVSGYDVLEVLHREPAYSDTRVILMTGVGLSEEMTPVYRIAVQSQEGFPLVKSLQVVQQIINGLSERVVEA